MEQILFGGEGGGEGVGVLCTGQKVEFLICTCGNVKGMSPFKYTKSVGRRPVSSFNAPEI